jgi:hypothetical protein
MVRYATTSNDLYVFSRSVEGSDVLVLVNLGKDAQAVEITSEAPAVEDKINYFTGEAEALPTTLNAGEYRVYINK